MNQEHAELEADWLAAELKRSSKYAREAYSEKDEAKRQLTLANLIGTLDTLHAHYSLFTSAPAEDGSSVEIPVYQRTVGRPEEGPFKKWWNGHTN